MNKLFKKTSTMLLVTASLITLASCDTTTTKTKVIWWNNYQMPTTGTEEENRNKSSYREYYFAEDLIAEFEKEHSDIEVEQVYKGAYSGNNSIASALTAALGSPKDLPNMASSYGDNVAIYNNAGVTLDMSSFYNDSSFDKSDLNTSYYDIEKDMYDGKFLSLPYSKSGEMFVVNKDVFDLEGAGAAGTDSLVTSSDGTVSGYKAPVALASKTKYSVPENFTDLITTARKMKADFPEVFTNNRDKNGLLTAVPFVWDSAQNMVISLFKNMNIDYTDSSSIKFNNEKAKQLLAQLTKWNKEGLIATQNQLYYSDEAKGYHQYSSTMMTSGTVFMCISSTAGARYFSGNGYHVSFHHTPNIDETIYSVDADTATIGTSKAKDAKVMSQGPSLTFFKKSEDGSDPSEKASWEFYKFLTNATNSTKLAVNTSYFPLHKSSYNDESIKKFVDAAKTDINKDTDKATKDNYAFGKAFELNSTYTDNSNYFLSPVFDKSAAARTAVGNIVAALFDDKNLTENSTDAEINAAVDKAFTDAYAQAIK